MKIKKIIISAVTILATTVLGFSQKIAHISLDSLVSAMPETKSAKEVAQSYLKDLEKTVMSMETELQTKYNDYLANEATMSELVKKTKQEELQGLQKRIEDFKVQAQQDYQKKYQDLIISRDLYKDKIAYAEANLEKLATNDRIADYKKIIERINIMNDILKQYALKRG